MQRTLRGGKHTHDAKSRGQVCPRRYATRDAVEKVCRLGMQRLDHRHLRDVDVSMPGGEELVELGELGWPVVALVVDP